MIDSALKELTAISEDDNVNTKNFIDAISFMDRACTVLDFISSILPESDFSFMPSFVSDEFPDYSKKIAKCSDDMSIFVVFSQKLGNDEVKEKLEESAKNSGKIDVNIDGDFMILHLILG